MITTSSASGADELRPALIRAQEVADGWADVVRLQRRATPPNHTDFYALAAEMVATLQAFDDLAQVLRRQVTCYASGRTLYDDTRTVDPAVRLSGAAVDLGRLVEYVQAP